MGNIGIPTFLVLFLIFLAVFRYRLSKAERINRKASKAFWDQEHSSHFIRKKLITEDDLIKPRLEDFPIFTMEDFEQMENPHIFKLQQDCLDLANKPMMNLGHLLNSEIRLKYGTANLELVQSYEENHTAYIKALYRLGKAYADADRPYEAIKVLEEGLWVKTDYSRHWLLLGSLYISKNHFTDYENLLKKASSINGSAQEKLLADLLLLSPKLP